MDDDRQKVRAASLACVLPFTVANLLAAPVSYRVSDDDPRFVLGCLCIGIIGAEGALHAIWCVLAPVRFAKRLAIGVAVGLVWYGAWALGYVASASLHGGPYSYHWEEIFIGLLCLPLVAIAIQSPLWFARIWLRWRIEHRADPARGSDDEPFQIRHLLGATAAVAVAFSAVRLAVPGDEEDFLIAFAIGALIAAAISLITTVPMVMATLRGRRMLLALPVILLLDVVAPLGFVVTLSIALQDRLPVTIYVGFAALGYSFFAGMAAVMLVARALGYRLAWGRHKTTMGNGDSAASGGSQDAGVH